MKLSLPAPPLNVTAGVPAELLRTESLPSPRLNVMEEIATVQVTVRGLAPAWVQLAAPPIDQATSESPDG